MSAKFSFYEVVEVRPERPALNEIAGLTGAILGMVENDDGNWVYAVHILDTDESWDIRESELVSTGKVMSRSDFYDENDSVGVEVDPITGEGKLKG
jgi:hypothetical protein